MKKLLLIFTIFFLHNASAAERSVTLELLGMYCAMCPVTVRSALDMSDGVDDVAVTRSPYHAIIKYDDEETSPEQLIKVVEDAGYGAKVISN